MIYYATVTRTSDALVYVTIPELGGTAEMGPYPAVGGPYVADDRVVVSRLSAVAEDLIVLGNFTAGAAPDGDIYGGEPTDTFTDEVDGGTP